jgi:hypothetical protein
MMENEDDKYSVSEKIVPFAKHSRNSLMPQGQSLFFMLVLQLENSLYLSGLKKNQMSQEEIADSYPSESWQYATRS